MSCLETAIVNGYKRVPEPPARTIPFLFCMIYLEVLFFSNYTEIITSNNCQVVQIYTLRLEYFASNQNYLGTIALFYGILKCGLA